MKEKLKAEMQARMDILQAQGYWNSAFELFKKGKICVSLPVNMGGETVGMIYTFESEPEMDAVKTEFEESTGNRVYAGMVNYGSGGWMLSLLFVGANEDEWEQEREYLEQKMPYAQVIAPCIEVNEYGTIVYDVRGGGLVRTA